MWEAGKIDNAYHPFTAGGLNWLVLNLEMWARTGAVDWAKTVLANHPRHNVIIISHHHLTKDSLIAQNHGGYGDTSPQYVFDNLIKQYANVRLVFSGHVGQAGDLESTGVQGNKLYQFLQHQLGSLNAPPTGRPTSWRPMTIKRITGRAPALPPTASSGRRTPAAPPWPTQA